MDALFPLAKFLTTVLHTSSLPSAQGGCLIGRWPSMPETWDQAGERFGRMTQEAVAAASGKNILLITHAEVIFGHVPSCHNLSDLLYASITE